MQGPQAAGQSAEAVLMVRPARFGWNPETQASNRFQCDEPALRHVATSQARAEFDGLVEHLRAAGIAVHVAHDAETPQCPDAVFPNNWVSFHADGTVVLYPMQAPNRRRERRLELITELLECAGRRATRLLDLTHHEVSNAFLEGTGSVVFDHPARVAYACLSPRTHPAPLEELCAELGYDACAFTATDLSGVPVYHTNVLLSIGTSVAIVATETIDPRDREQVTSRLAAPGRQVVTIDSMQMRCFAGNVLELRSTAGARVLAMSQRAAAALGATLDELRQHVDTIVAAPIPTIETLGGGSVRCMLAEVFLPR